MIVAGMVAGDPGQGGATWAVLQYVLGLRALGCDVIVVDPLPGPPSDEVLAYFDAVTGRFDLTGRAALVPPADPPHGMAAADVADGIRRCDVLINLSGRWRDHRRLAHIPRRVYLDMDPAFTQLWHAAGHDVGLDHHTHHLTVGAAVGAADWTLPTGGKRWWPTLPPVVLDEWPVQPTASIGAATTVANWRSYGSIDHDGIHFGQKVHAFRDLADLPTVSPAPLRVALAIHPGDDADLSVLQTAGWQLVDPIAAAGDPDRYQAFVQGSWAELGVAKTGYVVGRTGWVSDRSACYLASGRPVIAQDTGLEGVLPIGCGLLTFEGVDDAAAAIDAVAKDYDRHCRAARRIAEEHLDARLVLRRLLGHVFS